MSGKITFFTIVSRNYLAQAFVLGESVKRNHPESNFSIFLVDDIHRDYGEDIGRKGLSVVYPEDISIPNYKQFVFKYQMIEACTGVKPFVFQALLDQGADKVVYLDPDMLCFRPLSEAIELLDFSAIVITPHTLSPYEKNSYWANDLRLLQRGAYNLGFLGVANGVVGQRFLTWWKDKLTNECLLRLDKGLFVDQKWIDLVPAYFDRVTILKNPAYNLAYWNLHERSLKKEGGLFYVIESGTPLALVHFSRTDFKLLDNPPMFFEILPDSHPAKILEICKNRSDISELLYIYAGLIRANHYAYYSSIPYAFSTYSNGELIEGWERSAFMESPQWQKSAADPFHTGKGSFWEFCREKGRVEKKIFRNIFAKLCKKIGICLAVVFIRLMGVAYYFKLIDRLFLIGQDFQTKRNKIRTANESR
ncbi:MAG: hypothetical protein WCU74_01010 [Candidatus Omnitrophota bacterium]